jgi:hypothetical protein
MFSPPVHPRLQETNYHLEVGGRGEACKIRRTPLGEQGVMKLWLNSSEFSS